MGEKEEKINKLADSLHKGGFSTSGSGALEKAKEIVEIEEKIIESQKKKDFFKKSGDVKEIQAKSEDYDISKDNRTVSEIMKEAGISEAEPKPKEEKKEFHSENTQEVKEDLDTLEEEEEENINID